MRLLHHAVLAAVALALGDGAAGAQSSQDDFVAAYFRAQAASSRAAALKSQWTTTQSALLAAKDAADSRHYDAATRLAKHAEDLANASIAQSERENKLWKDAEIH